MSRHAILYHSSSTEMLQRQWADRMDCSRPMKSCPGNTLFSNFVQTWSLIHPWFGIFPSGESYRQNDSTITTQWQPYFWIHWFLSVFVRTLKILKSGGSFSVKRTGYWHCVTWVTGGDFACHNIFVVWLFYLWIDLFLKASVYTMILQAVSLSWWSK